MKTKMKIFTARRTVMRISPMSEQPQLHIWSECELMWSNRYEERSQASGSDHAPVSDDDDGEEEGEMSVYASART